MFLGSSNKNKVLFASTHLDSNALIKQKQELEFENQGNQEGTPGTMMRITFLYDLNTNKYEQITIIGYDAEGEFPLMETGWFSSIIWI